MEATLKYNLPEEESEFKMVLMGSSYYSVLWELDQYLRSDLKHNDSLTEQEYEKTNSIREKLNELMREHGVGFD